MLTMVTPLVTEKPTEQKKERKASKKDKKEKKIDKKREKDDDCGNRKRVKLSFEHQQQELEQTCEDDVPPSRIPDLRYILAPMVGASELAFRLLCRKYGATLAYTPMMDAARFANDESYRRSEFPVCSSSSSHYDRPLVCHFSANTPQDFAAAAMAAEPYCDAIDLNLGCPQRTAHIGHFGSYLLGPSDRTLVQSMIAAAARTVRIPICVKIRLLDTVAETTELVQQLHEAGASWIAIHARYRATWDRKGPGARDGPALLDQIATIRQQLPHVKLIANGNIVSFSDCEKNLRLTNADGVMSAEGILDNPALFLPRYGTNLEQTMEIPCMLTWNTPLPSSPPSSTTSQDVSAEKTRKKKRKLAKKLSKIQEMEVKLRCGEKLLEEENEMLRTKSKLETKLALLNCDTAISPGDASKITTTTSNESNTTTITLRELTAWASNKVNLANEYLSLARQYPPSIRTVVFHIRRMLRDELTRYQLLDDCVAAPTLQDVQRIVDQVAAYQKDPSTFSYDRQKAAREKEALAKKKHEEGKRKRFEDRMIRKAKREGREDLEFYLRVGTVLPTPSVIAKLKTMSHEEQLRDWKVHQFSQHCMAYHLVGKCQRDRKCAFLHVDLQQQAGGNSFVESEEVAG
jgi:tRNA-dihydrouridine synthase 1